MVQEVPWFMLSPSFVSIAQYLVLTWLVYRHIEGSKLKRFVLGFMVVAFFVLIGDAIWAGFCGLKWIPMFPSDAEQISFSFLRDLCGILLMIFMAGDLFLERKLRFDAITFTAIATGLIMQFVWFAYAPSPAFTDYTFAFRHGYSFDVVLTAWLLGHWIMRIPIWIAIWSTFRGVKKI